VEWAEKGKGFLPAPDLELALENDGPGRRIHWHARSDKGVEMALRLNEMTATWNAGP